MSDLVQTPRGTGTIVESETVRGRTSHLVAGTGFKQWFPETQIRVASPEDGWEPIPEDEHPGNPFGEAGPDPAMAAMPEEGMGDILEGLSEFAATGQLNPEDAIQYSGSPDPNSILGGLFPSPRSHNDPSRYRKREREQLVELQSRPDHPNAEQYWADFEKGMRETKESSRDEHGYFLGGPGDNVDKSNSVRLPYNPDPQHDAVYSEPDASWGPGEYTIDADERLHPSNSLTLNDVPHSEAGDEPGPANHLFAGYDPAVHGAAPKLDSRYATPLLYSAADHFNDPVQMFRDDSHGFIERRGSTYSEHDAELDRYASLLDTDRTIRTAAWKDIQSKAKRLRREGKVSVKDISPDRIYATVQGDNGTYETMITKGSSLGGYDAYGPHGDQSVGNWHCSCKWGNWAFKRRFTFIGRLCSHGLASYWEMQAAHNNDEQYVDKRRSKVRTKRAELTFNPEDRQLDRDRGLGPIIDQYGPHDDFDPEAEFLRRTELAQDYAEEQDALEGDGLDQIPGVLDADLEAEFLDRTEAAQDYAAEQEALYGREARRHADFLRTTPRGMTPQLNHIPKEREHRTVDVTSLEDTEMLGAAEEGTEREAMRLGRRIVGWIVDEVLPQFEEWYAQNHGQQLDQARPTEAAQAAAEFAHEMHLDQATSEMLQEFINQDFGPEDMEDAENNEEIKHFTAAAGRYLMASVRVAAPGDEDDPLGQLFGLNPPASSGAVPANPGPAAPNPLSDILQYGAPTAPGSAVRGGPNLVPTGAPDSAFDIPTNQGQGAGPTTPDAPAAAPAAGTPASGAGAGPAPGPAAGGADSPLSGEYTIQGGDTLSDLAQRSGWGDNYQGLADAAGIEDPDMILEGDTINLGDGSGAIPHGGGGAPAAPAAGTTAPEGNATDVTSLPTSGTPSTPTDTTPGTSVPSATPGLEMPVLAPASGPANTSTELTGSRHRLASDDRLIQHLRDLSSRGVEASDYGSMAARNADVRKTVDELRDRGYDANQLVAMVFTAAPAAPAYGGYETIPADNGGESSSAPGGSQTDEEASQVSSPTSQSPTEGGGSDPGSGIGADFMSMMPGLIDGIGGGIGAIGDALSGLSGGAGLGGGIGGAMSGMADMASGFTGLLGARVSDGDEDSALLGFDPPDATSTPTGYAGSGPDKQSWASSSEDYVEEYEQRYREQVDSESGDITRYSAFDNAMRQANAFDNYGDWAYAQSGGSADPSDWDSVESFLSEAEDRQQGITNLEPARDLINDHLQFRASRMPYPAAANSGYFGVGAQPGLPTAPGISHSNGAANLKGVTKPKKVKPPNPPGLQVAPPKPAQVMQQPPQQQGFMPPPGIPQQQLAQPRAPMVQGQPGSSGLNALGKPKRTEGGIARQAAQVHQGTLNSAFGEMGAPAPEMVAAYGGQPQYHEAGAFPTMMGGYDGGYAPQPFSHEQQMYGQPTQHLGGFGWEPLPGQAGSPNEAMPQQYQAAGPPDAFGSKMLAAHMGTGGGQQVQAAYQPQVAHDQQAAAAMGEYRTPHPSSYGQTNDSSDVVRQFHAQMGGAEWMTDYQPTGPGNGYGMGLPPNAHMAGRQYSLAEQAALEQESHIHGARNLGELDLRGTHYLGEA